MTPRRDITELELLALVEGDDAALTRERREALLGDSTVVRLVAKLSADRTAVSSLPRTVPAPAGLVAAAMERAQREALETLAAAESAATPAPPQYRTSSVVVERPGVLAKLMHTRWPQRFAAAAGVAIAAVGVYFVAAALIDWNSSQPSRAIVVTPAPTEDSPETPLRTETTPTPTEIALAPALAPTAPDAGSSLTVANGPIDTATAVTLVPEGRVVLVVRASDPQKVLASAGGIAQQRAGATLWQPLAADSPEYASAIAAARAGGFEFSGAKPPTVALMGLTASTKAFDAVLASLRAEAGDIAAGTLQPQWAALDATALRATRDRAALATLQPHRVLWWEQGSSAWTVPVVVPVVILPE